MESRAYAGSIAGMATDVDSDSLIYSKTSGPAWLVVAANGDLSGIPTRSDIGLNRFRVNAADGKGGTGRATLEITVQRDTSVWQTVSSEDFEGQAPGTRTPPAGWSLITVAGAPTYAVTATGQGSQGDGTSAGLAAKVHSSDFLGSPWSGLPGAYLVKNTDYDLTSGLRVTFDFQISQKGDWDDVVFVLGAVDDGVSAASAGELLATKIAEAGGASVATGLGTSSDQIGSVAADLSDDTWYRATATWSPSSGSTGTLAVTVNDFTSDECTIVTTGFSFDSPEGQIGFGSVNDTITFDNVKVERRVPAVD